MLSALESGVVVAEHAFGMMWLGAGYSDGSAKEAERPVRCVRAGQESEPA